MSTHTITVPDDQYGAMTPDAPVLWAVWELIS